MTIPRRTFVGSAVAAATTLCLPLASRAQDVGRMIVPFPAGGPADVFARLLIDSGLGKSIGRRYVVDNKPGAGGTIGCQAAASAPADGSTLLFSATSFVQSAALYAKPGYDPITDFAPISQVGTTHVILAVAASHPAKNLADFVRLARDKPTTYASAGNGSPTHLYGHLFAAEAKADLTHIPYKGEAPALTDLLGGQVDSGFFAPVTIGQYVAAGKLRALAITGAKPSARFSGVPTLKEAGYKGFDTTGWFGVFAPANVSPDTVANLARDVRSAVQMPATQKWLGDNQIEYVDMPPAEFSAVISRDLAYWKRLVKQANVTIT